MENGKLRVPKIFGSYSHDGVTQPMQICLLHIRDDALRGALSDGALVTAEAI